MASFDVHTLNRRKVTIRSNAFEEGLAGTVTAVSEPCWSRDRGLANTGSKSLVCLDGGGSATTSGSQLVLTSLEGSAPEQRSR